ncbi:dienelactone hydrolase family protein [Microbacterium immunditiarum]|uniref:Dienelactone hydrolase n=1 Tax=Microbacterium immunditiarum TaxID=337480 RepID=A0A7Y9KJR9_9MICO|nr:dienelactone hydrolase family protein [Microbacterium immunditiarum]NYE19956.1 dienelactone hydrolase [Microbacterium immunditiarum]
MKELDDWSLTTFSAGDETREVYRKDPPGGGRTGVIVLHEIPGIQPVLVDFANELVDHGHIVLLPRLFGTPGAGYSLPNVAGDLWQFCVRREFAILARGRTSPVAGWLRALARDLHEELGGEGVGVIGMCFTGGFALAMMADAPVIAPVVAEPSLPAAVGLPRGARLRGADLGLSPDDLRAVKSSSTQVLGLRYRCDPAVGSRWETLERELGGRFFAVDFDGKGHSVLTRDRQQAGVDRVIAFLDEKLLAGASRPVE